MEIEESEETKHSSRIDRMWDPAPTEVITLRLPDEVLLKLERVADLARIPLATVVQVILALEVSRNECNSDAASDSVDSAEPASAAGSQD